MTIPQTPARPAGHPRHQLRPFDVSASYAGSPGAVELSVPAQTERDALLRTGLELARRFPGSDPTLWTVTAVTDPAPLTWCPGEDAAPVTATQPPPAGKIRFEAFSKATGQREAVNEWDAADRPKLTAYVTRWTARGACRVTLTWPDGGTKTYPRGE